jgi:hypothetical protein
MHAMYYRFVRVSVVTNRTRSSTFNIQCSTINRDAILAAIPYGDAFPTYSFWTLLLASI